MAESDFARRCWLMVSTFFILCFGFIGEMFFVLKLVHCAPSFTSSLKTASFSVTFFCKLSSMRSLKIASLSVACLRERPEVLEVLREVREDGGRDGGCSKSANDTASCSRGLTYS
jgi:hypothetical protein